MPADQLRSGDKRTCRPFVGPRPRGFPPPDAGPLKGADGFSQSVDHLLNLLGSRMCRRSSHQPPKVRFDAGEQSFSFLL